MESKHNRKQYPWLNQMIPAPVLFAALIVLLSIWIGGVVKSGTETRPNPDHSRLSTQTVLPIQSADRLQPGTFLIAARGMKDPNFAQTVVLLIDYDVQGAFGLIIDRPTRHTLESPSDMACFIVSFLL